MRLEMGEKEYRQTLEAISSSDPIRVRTAGGEDLLPEILLILIASL